MQLGVKNEKNFLVDEVKSIFDNYLRVISKIKAK